MSPSSTGVLGPPAAATPAPANAAPASGGPSRLLAVVLDRPGAVAVLDAACAAARETGAEVHAAVLLPRLPLTLDAALLARLAEQVHREVDAIIALAGHRAAAAGVPVRVGVHRLAGLHGRRHQQVLDRAVARLAHRLDAVLAPGTTS